MKKKSYFHRFYYIFVFWPFIPNLLYAQFEPALSITPEQDQQQVNSVSISSDGRLVVTCTDRPILWDAQTGEKIRTYHGHDGLLVNNIGPVVIYSSAFSNDNRFLITGDDGFYAVVSDVNTGEVIFRCRSYDLYPLGFGMLGVSFTPDGNKVLTGASNGALQLWDVRTGDELKRYRDRGGVQTLFILPDGNRAIIWRAGAVIIIDLQNDQNMESFSGAYPSLSSDGQILQIRSGNRLDGYRIQHWNMNNYTLLNEFPLESGQLIGTATISPDGHDFLLGAYTDLQATNVFNRTLYESATRNSLRQYPVDRASASNSPFSQDSIIKYFPNGRRFLTVNNGTVHIWDISDVVTKVEDAFLH